MSETCKWTYDEKGAWDTGCINRFELIEGTPHENNMQFCAYCGKRLEEVLTADDLEPDVSLPGLKTEDSRSKIR